MGATPFGVGLFLPMANGGWVISKDRPEVDGSYALNRRVAAIAEAAGFDFAIAMAKWRGYGGITRHWDYTLDSLAMCCGLAESTKRMDLYCTIHTTVFNPVPIAKMMATFDQIARGRAGMNVVAKSYNPETAQMGLAPIEETRRYDHAREWLTVIKRLWTEARVDFHGEFFQIEDCVSDPKPLRSPRPPLICAGISDVGRRFSIEETDGCLISANDQEALKQRSHHVKRLAAELGRTTNTIALIMVVPGRTTAEAQARVDRYNGAADLEALHGVAKSFGMMASASSITQLALDGKAVGMMSGYPLAADADGTVALLTDLFEDGGLDGVVLTVPDFIDDLEWVGEKVMPVLEQRGFTRRAEHSTAVPV